MFNKHPSVLTFLFGLIGGHQHAVGDLQVHRASLQPDGAGRGRRRCDLDPLYKYMYTQTSLTQNNPQHLSNGMQSLENLKIGHKFNTLSLKNAPIISFLISIRIL